MLHQKKRNMGQAHEGRFSVRGGGKNKGNQNLPLGCKRRKGKVPGEIRLARLWEWEGVGCLAAYEAKRSQGV